MAQQVLEGTWEEIAAHADEFVGLRLKVLVQEVAEADEVPNIGPPNLGPPNEAALRMLQKLEERQQGRRYTSGAALYIRRRNTGFNSAGTQWRHVWQRIR